MQRPHRAFGLLSLLLVLMLAMVGCEGLGPGNVVNLEESQVGPGLEEQIEESGLEGQTGLSGQEVEAEDTVEGQIEASQAVYRLTNLEQMVPASWLLDRDIETLFDRDLGSIADLVVERATGRVLFALVDHHGLLGISERELPVPLAALQWREQEDFMIDVEEDAWDSFPGLGDDWTTNLTREHIDVIRIFWATTGVELRETDIDSADDVMRLSTLLEGRVEGGDTGEVGQVRNAVLDLSTGTIKYLAVAPTGDLTAGENRVALVPYGAFDLQNAEQPSLAETFDPSLLPNAPRVEESALAETQPMEPGWDEEVEAYWGNAGFSF